MKSLFRKILLTLTMFCLCLCISFTTVTAEAATIFLVGDSTVCEYGNDSGYSYGRNGWGMKLGEFFKDDIKIENLALSGRSSKSFLKESSYNKLKKELQQGDYLLIQFGHNDEKADRASRKTDIGDLTRHSTSTGDETQKGSYQYYLYEYYVRLAQARGATPILVTPIVRHKFTADGKILDSHHSDVKAEAGTRSYDNAMRDLAKRKQIMLIDLNQSTTTLYNKLGEAESGKFHAVFSDGRLDHTHLNPEGARAVAKMVAAEIKKSNLPLKALLR